jgi:Cytochrome C1 family
MLMGDGWGHRQGDRMKKCGLPDVAAEPNLEERKRLGFSVLIFLILYAWLLLVVKRKIWSRAEARVTHD